MQIRRNVKTEKQLLKVGSVETKSLHFLEFFQSQQPPHMMLDSVSSDVHVTWYIVQIRLFREESELLTL